MAAARRAIPRGELSHGRGAAVVEELSRTEVNRLRLAVHVSRSRGTARTRNVSNWLDVLRRGPVLAVLSPYQTVRLVVVLNFLRLRIEVQDTADARGYVAQVTQ